MYLPRLYHSMLIYYKMIILLRETPHAKALITQEYHSPKPNIKINLCILIGDDIKPKRIESFINLEASFA